MTRPLKGSGGTGGPGGVQVEPPKGRIKIKITRAHIDAIAAWILGRMLTRLENGIDADGRPFAAYSDTYRRQLAAIGQDVDVDFSVTGGLRASLAERSRKMAGDIAEVVMGPKTTTSPAVRMPSKATLDSPEALAKWMKKYGGRASRIRGKRSPAHNRVAYWHQTGAGRLPVRKLIGLTPQDRKDLVAFVVKLGLASSPTTRPRKGG